VDLVFYGILTVIFCRFKQLETRTLGITLSKEDLEQLVEKVSSEVEQAKRTVSSSDQKDVVNIHRGRVARLDTFARKAFAFKKPDAENVEPNKSTVVDFKQAAKPAK